MFSIFPTAFSIHTGWKTEQFLRRRNLRHKPVGLSLVEGSQIMTDLNTVFPGCFLIPASVEHLCLILAEGDGQWPGNGDQDSTLCISFSSLNLKMQRSRWLNQPLSFRQWSSVDSPFPLIVLDAPISRLDWGFMGWRQLEQDNVSCQGYRNASPCFRIFFFWELLQRKLLREPKPLRETSHS